MSTYVAGRSTGSAQDAADAQATMDVVVGVLEAAARRQLPEDAKIMLSVIASAVELLTRTPAFSELTNEEVALAVGLGFGTAVMKGRGGLEVRPGAILHELGSGVGQAVHSFTLSAGARFQ